MKEWTVDEIKGLLECNDQMVCTSLLKVYALQTAEEQQSGETKEHNNVGFNGVDANFLSSCAEFLKKSGFLTSRQMPLVRKKMMKYAKQVTWLANEHEKNKELQKQVQATIQNIKGE